MYSKIKKQLTRDQRAVSISNPNPLEGEGLVGITKLVISGGVTVIVNDIVQ